MTTAIITMKQLREARQLRLAFMQTSGGNEPIPSIQEILEGVLADDAAMAVLRAEVLKEGGAKSGLP